MNESGHIPEGLSAEDARHVVQVAGGLLAQVFGDGWLCSELASGFNCTEVDHIARALMLLGQPDAAVALVSWHAGASNEDGGDTHWRLRVVDPETADRSPDCESDVDHDAVRAYVNGLLFLLSELTDATREEG